MRDASANCTCELCLALLKIIARAHMCLCLKNFMANFLHSLANAAQQVQQGLCARVVFPPSLGVRSARELRMRNAMIANLGRSISAGGARARPVFAVTHWRVRTIDAMIAARIPEHSQRPSRAPQKAAASMRVAARYAINRSQRRRRRPPSLALIGQLIESLRHLRARTRVIYARQTGAHAIDAAARASLK